MKNRGENEVQTALFCVRKMLHLKTEVFQIEAVFIRRWTQIMGITARRS